MDVDKIQRTLKAKRDALADELAEVYPHVVSTLADLLGRMGETTVMTLAV